MATIRATAAFSWFEAKFLPLDGDVLSLTRYFNSNTQVGAKKYVDALSVNYWFADYNGGGYVQEKPATTLLGGKNFALSTDGLLVDGTINAIAKYSEGQSAPDYILEGLKVSAPALAAAQADPVSSFSSSAFELLFSGNDKFVLSERDDRVLAGDGNDTVYSRGGMDIIDAGRGDDVVYGGAENDQINGGFGNDKLYGGAGDDTLFDDGGTDLFDGGAGRDTFKINVSSGDEVTVDLRISGPQAVGIRGLATLVSIEGLVGGYGSETLIGNDASNSLRGLGGDDTLSGGGGGDWLQGDDGLDILTGGAGKDRFALSDLLSSKPARDIITDFSHADGDRILVSNIAITGKANTGITRMDASAFYSAPTAKSGHDATDRIIYNTTTGVLYFDADGSGKTAPVAIALITGPDGVTHPSLTYADFLLF